MGLNSWQFCERALQKAHLALTPRKDFGSCRADTDVRFSNAASTDSRTALEVASLMAISCPVQFSSSAGYLRSSRKPDITEDMQKEKAFHDHPFLAGRRWL